MSRFGIIALTPALFTDMKRGNSPSQNDAHIQDGESFGLDVAVAAARAGEIGVIDLEFSNLCTQHIEHTNSVLKRVLQDNGTCGIRCGVSQAEKLSGWIESLKPDLKNSYPIKIVLIPDSAHKKVLERAIKALAKQKVDVFVEAINIEEALAGEKAGAQAIIAKGHEAGGRIGELTTFVLLQQCLHQLTVPVWAYGGIGLHTAAACVAAGAKGVVLDCQLLLTNESPVPLELKHRISRMDGTETTIVKDHLETNGIAYRIYARPSHPIFEATGKRQDVKATIAEFASCPIWHDRIWLFGQDIAFARGLGNRGHSVSGVIQAIKEAVNLHIEQAVKIKPLTEHSPLAKSHGTHYPIVQGAMTRVSDTADFAASVAKAGALPFLALALMRKEEIETLLTDSKLKLNESSWGVGILGFVPQQLRQEQLEVIRRFKPPYALIAGGRPDQAKALEDIGIKTYLHVPSPMLLSSFVEMGARRFVFEGKECGGHVGPRSSFVLWEAMIETLLDTIAPHEDGGQYHVLFAGGVHDALSAVMVAAMSSTLTQRGIKVGVLMGTAYLFTKEAVDSGAIVKKFQEAALNCNHTVLLETGPGHAIRCIDSPYKTAFDTKLQELTSENKSRDEIREELELMNLGRLRIASKGLSRNTGSLTSNERAELMAHQDNKKLVKLSEDEQWDQGMYMVGQVAALKQEIYSMAQLHEDVSLTSTQFIHDKFASVPADPVIESVTDLGQMISGGEKPAGKNVVTAVSEDTHTVTRPESIAIVGMSCQFPKANSLNEYWHNILNKVDAIEEVPKDQWNWENYYSSDPQARDKIHSKWGGFLSDLKFNPTRYGIPPKSLQSIDPMQLLLLEAARAAIEDAGYTERSFPHERTSVILANAGHGPITALYSLRSMLGWKLAHLDDSAKAQIESILPEWTEDSFPGYLGNVAAGRVANRLDLGGINFSIDAACASSLAALYVAVGDLRNRHSDVVLLAGSDTHNQPGDYLSFSKTHAFSPRGRCYTFDATADGIVISEGIAMLMLKRLSDAERDGDKIYAVIAGIGGSSDGRDLSLTAPRPAGQVLALERAYTNAHISPSTVTLIEAHGTGTVAGDKAEIEALRQVFEQAKAETRTCAVGSVKTMIGHTKAAAGLASLIKVAKALYHKVLPPTLGVTVPNPACKFQSSPFYINSETRPWILGSKNGSIRRAGVSAFGFGGTNFHAVLEEYRGALNQQVFPSSPLWTGELFLFRGKTRNELLRAADNLSETVKRLAHNSELPPDILKVLACAHHLKESDKFFASRHSTGNRHGLCLSIIASNIHDLQEKLLLAKNQLIDSSCREIKNPKGIYFSEGNISEDNQGKIAFLFPGQGSQQINMLKDLAVEFPEIRSSFERADKVLYGLLPKSLSSYVYPPPAFTKPEESQQFEELTNTHIAQPAVGTADLAMFKLLKAFGITPDMVAGHSYGEYAALCAAGSMSEDDLLRLSEKRGRILSRNVSDVAGTMAALTCTADEVKKLLNDVSGVTLANINAPNQYVISGNVADIKLALTKGQEQGLNAKMIPVSQAFHSSLMAHAQPPLKEALEAIDISAPHLTVYSNTDAKPYAADPSTVSRKLVEHIVHPVDFVSQIEQMYEDGARLFVEVGPGAVLTGLIGSTLKEKPHIALSIDRPGRQGLLHLLHVLGQLASYGAPIDIGRLFHNRIEHVGSIDTLLSSLSEPRQNVDRLAYLVNSARITPVESNPAPADKSPIKTLSKEAGNKQLDTPKKAKAFSPSSFNPTANDIPKREAESTHGRVSQSTRDSGFSNTDNTFVKVITQSKETDPKTFDDDTPHYERLTLPGTPGSIQAGRNVDQVMLEFQQTMLKMTHSFLETQQQVMLAYLCAKYPGAQNTLPSLSTPPRSQVSPSSLQESFLPQASIASLSSVTAPFSSNQNINEQVANNIQRASARQSNESASVFRTAGISPELAEQSGKSAPASGLVAGSIEHHDAAYNHTIEAQSHVPSNDELISQLLDIVSQRTGYPPEMLDPSLDLEADLGIDSIKRVEILNSFRRILPQVKQEELESGIEELAQTKTLQGIINWIYSASALNSDENGKKDLSVSSSSKMEFAESSHTDFANSNPMSDTEHDGNGHDSYASPGLPTLQFTHSLHNNGNEDKVSTDGNGKHPASLDQIKALAQSFDSFEPALDTTSNIRRGLVSTSQLPGLRATRFTNNRVVLILSDPKGVATILSNELQSRGIKGVVVSQNSKISQTDITLSYQSDFSSPETIEQLLKRVRSEHGPVGAFIDLTFLGEASTESACSHVKSLFVFAKYLQDDLINTDIGAAVLVATSMGGDFGVGSAPPMSQAASVQAGAVGLVKSLAKEWSQVRCMALDFSPEMSASELAKKITTELDRTADRVEICYQGDKRLGLEVVSSPLTYDQCSDLEFDSSSVFLITGGARGITAEIALELAHKYKPTIIVVGRTEHPTAFDQELIAPSSSIRDLKAQIMEKLRADGKNVTIAQVEAVYQKLVREREVSENLARLEQSGAHIEYHCVDVTQSREFGCLLDDLYERHGKIDGVIQGAGVIEDAYIKGKSPVSFNRVFDTKVKSALTLLQKLKLDSLKLLVFFSSVVGRTGNAGQTDYVAANEVLNKLALHVDRQVSARVVSIMWGPWKAGMAQPELESIFAKHGWAMIDRNSGSKAFIDELIFGKKGQVEVLLVAELGRVNESPSTNTTVQFQDSILSYPQPGVFEFSSSLHLDKDLYLKDHTFDGIPVMPMAMAFEMMTEAATIVYPGFSLLKASNFDIPSGIVIEAQSKPITITIRETSRSETGVKLDATFGTVSPRPRANFRCMIELSKCHHDVRLLDEVAVSVPRDIPRRLISYEELTELENIVEPPPVKEIYTSWLFHGPAFQGIKRIAALGSNGIVGEIMPSLPSSCLRNTGVQSWLVDPILLDSAMQLAGVWAKQFLQMTVLPTGFKNFYRCAKLDTKPMLGRVYVDPFLHSREMTCDIAVYRQDGVLAFVIEGLGGVGSKSLNRLASQPNQQELRFTSKSFPT